MIDSSMIDSLSDVARLRQLPDLSQRYALSAKIEEISNLMLARVGPLYSPRNACGVCKRD